MSNFPQFYQLLKVNRLFMADQKEINAALISTFLGVAIWYEEHNAGSRLSFGDLARRLGLPASTVSRHLRYLGERQRKGVPGMGLVEVMTADEDARRKWVRLTPAGKELAARVQGLMAVTVQ